MSPELRRDMQLPAELADIADADGEHRGRAQGDLPRRGEGKGGVAHILLRHALQHLARALARRD